MVSDLFSFFLFCPPSAITHHIQLLFLLHHFFVLCWSIHQVDLINMVFFNKKCCAAALLLCSQTDAFAPCTRNHPVASTTLQAHAQNDVAKAAATLFLGAGIMASTLFPGAAFADEIGVEKEAPTLFTGETTEVGVVAFKLKLYTCRLPLLILSHWFFTF